MVNANVPEPILDSRTTRSRITSANEPRAVHGHRRVGSIRVLARCSVVEAAHVRARVASSSLTSGQS